MARPTVRKENWTLLFDSKLKQLAITAAKRKGIAPVTLLEHLVREKLNPYGYTDVEDSAAYTTALRKRSRKQSDDAFFAEIEAWTKHRAS